MVGIPDAIGVISFAMFEVLTAVKLQIEILWVVRMCSVAERYNHFSGPCSLQGENGSNMDL